MFIICKNDFPYKVCPVGISRGCAEGIAKHYQDECGLQIGLADKTYFHVVWLEYVPVELTIKLEQEIENGD